MLENGVITLHLWVFEGPVYAMFFVFFQILLAILTLFFIYVQIRLAIIIIKFFAP
jgi:hypothetical protein